jgi:hypothetical protein
MWSNCRDDLQARQREFPMPSGLCVPPQDLRFRYLATVLPTPGKLSGRIAVPRRWLIAGWSYTVKACTMPGA